MKIHFCCVDGFLAKLQVFYTITARIFCILQIPEKTGSKMRQQISHQLFIHSKEVYSSVRREVLYDSLTKSSILMKLVVQVNCM
jgi:hypothetical protein